MKPLLAALLAVSIATPVAAQKDMPANLVVLCAGVSSDAARLACYDGAARGLGIPTAKTTQGGPGKWLVHESKSKMDDSRQVTLMLTAEDAVSRPIGSDYHPNLFVRCTEKRTSVFLVVEQVIDAASSQVMYRVDEAPATTSNWGRSSDYKAVGLWSGAEAIPFLKKLAGAKTLVMRFKPHSDGPRTTSFTLEGYDEAIKSVRSACGW